MIGEPHTESDLSALESEGEPQARGLRRLLPFLSKSRPKIIAPRVAIHTAADGEQPNVDQHQPPNHHPL